MPVTSVRDLVVHGDDLAVATYGRGFWVLDDMSSLRQIAAEGHKIEAAQDLALRSRGDASPFARAGRTALRCRMRSRRS